MLLSEHNSEFVTMGPYRSFIEGPRLPVKIGRISIVFSFVSVDVLVFYFCHYIHLC